MSILTTCCDFKECVIQVVDIARTLVGLMRVLNALVHCHVISPEKLFSSSQMTFPCVSFPLFGLARATHDFFVQVRSIRRFAVSGIL